MKQSKHFEVAIPFPEQMRVLGMLTTVELCVNGVAYEVECEDAHGTYYEYDYDIDEIWWTAEDGQRVNLLPVINALNSGSAKECDDIDRSVEKMLPELFTVKHAA